MDVSEKIASFKHWHYDFEIEGQRTSPDRARWQEIRAAQSIGPAVELFGGSLAGRRVLDLGCNGGFFSLKAIEAGAEFVLGIDGREMYVAQAQFIFDAYGIETSRYAFVCGSFLDFPFKDYGPFDLVLCLGVLYHVSSPLHLLERISEVNSDVLVIDTKLSRLEGAAMEVHRENVDGPLNAVNESLVLVPTMQAVVTLVRAVGYPAVGLLPPVSPEDPVMERYRFGIFGTFVCTKERDISGLRFQTKNATRAGTARRSRPCRLDPPREDQEATSDTSTY